MQDPVPFLRPPPPSKPKRRSRFIWLVPILIVAGVLTWGYIPTSTGPASGTALTGSTIRSTNRSTLRVATFNIHSGRNASESLNLDRTAATLKRDFDVIALNEVRGSPPGSDDPNQAALLGQKLSMQSLFAPTERKWWRDDFGNGVLSAISVVDWKRTPLAGSLGRGKRNLVQVRVMFQGTPVNILITHIDRGADREKQLRLVMEQFLKATPPAVVMGDFNTSGDDAELKRVRSTEGVKVMGGITSDSIDWILVRGLQIVDGDVEKNDASDHPLVWAELKLPDKK